VGKHVALFFALSRDDVILPSLGFVLIDVLIDAININHIRQWG
jgi:hypothetical protein